MQNRSELENQALISSGIDLFQRPQAVSTKKLGFVRFFKVG